MMVKINLVFLGKCFFWGDGGRKFFFALKIVIVCWLRWKVSIQTSDFCSPHVWNDSDQCGCYGGQWRLELKKEWKFMNLGEGGPWIHQDMGLWGTYRWPCKWVTGVITPIITGSRANLGREVGILQLYFLKTFCWWFRNPANHVEVDSLSHYLQGFFASQRGAGSSTNSITRSLKLYLIHCTVLGKDETVDGTWWWSKTEGKTVVSTCEHSRRELGCKCIKSRKEMHLYIIFCTRQLKPNQDQDV